MDLFAVISHCVGAPFFTVLLGLRRGLQRDVVYLGWPIATSHTSPNAGEGGCGVSAND
jgi:hypothetical protein